MTRNAPGVSETEVTSRGGRQTPAKGIRLSKDSV